MHAVFFKKNIKGPASSGPPDKNVELKKISKDLLFNKSGLKNISKDRLTNKRDFLKKNIKGPPGKQMWILKELYQRTFR